MEETEVCRHSFTFNENDNGGEELSLTTIYFSNGDEGDEGIYTNQELRLGSYCNSASISLFGIQITPDILRQLANELEQARNSIKISKNTRPTHYNDNTKIVKVIDDDRYAKKYSHKEFTRSNWSWGLDAKGNLYFIGAISGKGCESQWSKMGEMSIPLDVEDLKVINKILNNK